MFDDMYFKNENDQIMHWNEDPDGNGYFAVEEVHFDLDARSNDRNKMQAQGVWPSYTYFGRMLIHINGHILADTSTQLNNYKLRLMQTIMPARFNLAFNRHVGWLYLKFTGQSEYFYTECGLESAPDITNGALAPSVVPCQIALKSFLPYMYGEITGNRYWVA
jgi:hypothetical protein